MVTWTIYFVSSITVLATAVIAPAMGSMSAYFQGVDPLLIKFILTMPSFFVMLTSLFCPRLCVRFGKKTILLTALIIYAISGCLSGLTTNIYAMLISRACLGVGVGLITPISQSLPADFFTGSQKVQVIARSNAAVNLGNVIFIFISGYLAMISWRYSFLVYLVALPVFVAAYFNLPAENLRYEVTKTTNKRLPFLAYFVPVCISFLMMSTYIVFANLAILMEHRGLGGASVAGNAFTLTQIFAFTTAYNTLKIRNLFGRYLVSVILLCLSCTFGLIYFADSMIFVYIACMCMGSVFGMGMPLAPVTLSNVVEQSSLVKAMAYLTVGLFFGQFFSPFFTELLPRVPGYNDEFGFFFSLFVLAVIILCIFTVYTTFKKKA